MSNFQERDDWWQGVDGKWYPPVARKVDASPTYEPEESVYLSHARPNRRRINLLGTAAAVITAIGVFVYQSREVETRSMFFAIELIDQSPESFGWSVRADCDGVSSVFPACRCEIADSYSDLDGNTEVVVFGKSGKELARTTLNGDGRVFKMGDSTALSDPNRLPSTAARKCEWETRFIDIPTNEDSYLVKFGSRGEISFDSTDQAFLQMLTIEDD
jgi:hypothetical protein